MSDKGYRRLKMNLYQSSRSLVNRDMVKKKARRRHESPIILWPRVFKDFGPQKQASPYPQEKEDGEDVLNQSPRLVSHISSIIEMDTKNTTKKMKSFTSCPLLSFHHSL